MKLKNILFAAGLSLFGCDKEQIPKPNNNSIDSICKREPAKIKKFQENLCNLKDNEYNCKNSAHLYFEVTDSGCNPGIKHLVLYQDNNPIKVIKGEGEILKVLIPQITDSRKTRTYRIEAIDIDGNKTTSQDITVHYNKN